MKAAAIDLGGTSLRMGCVDESGKVYGFEKHAQAEVLGGAPVEHLAAFVQAYLNRHGETVPALALTIPGTLSADKSTVLSAPNVAGLDGVNLRDALTRALEMPVFLLKDVTALLYHDINALNITDEGVTVACYIGTGLGNAIFIGGRVYEGHNGSAGELGHTPVAGTSLVCPCGNSGCSEMTAGGKALERLQREHFPGTEIRRLWLEQGGHPLLASFLEHLSMVIAAELNILDPGTLLLGGGVLSMPGFPKERLEESIRKHTRKPLPEENLRIFFPPDKGDNGVAGAGIYIWKTQRSSFAPR